jgi:outer membrane protein OmpA-like peptidoglycan-associated protein/Tol biopolymer transport system component
MKNLLLAAFVLILSAPFVNAQDEDDPSCMPPDKKVIKILDKAKISSAQDAAKLFKDATDAAPENAMVYFEFAMYTFEEAQEAAKLNVQKAEKLLKKAQGLFEKCLAMCDNYHADVYFYLGGIHYMLGEKEAAKQQFQRFINYKSTDTKRYPEDFDKKKLEAQKLIGVAKQEEQTLGNPVPFSPAIVRNVSTARDEFFPTISPDNELMFFTRRETRKEMDAMTSKVVEEFTVASRVELNSPFNSGTPLPFPFNDGTFNNYGASTVSVDNKEMILCACKTETVFGQQYNNCDLYSTKYERDEKGKFNWTPLENLGPNINTKDGWEGQPSLSADGNTLYFTAVRPNTQKDDILVSKRREDGTWSLAVPLKEINTSGRDKSPFIHQDSKTLYFVSDVGPGREGVGGLDIFYSRMDDNGKWSKPVNIGFPINTDADEIGLFVSTDGTLAYYSSREKGVWNIYSFELYPEARPQKVLFVKGELSSSDKENLSDVTIDINYADGRTEQVRVNGNDGKYAAVIQADKPQDVMLTVNKDGSAFDSRFIDEETVAKETFSRNQNMEVRPIEKGASYTINDILFATNSFELTERSKFILRQFAAFLKANPTIKVSIHGHTDDIGDDAKNMTLSINRAKAVMDYLVSQGVKASRMKHAGFGETKPKVPNTNETNRALNRRTEFVIDEV